MTLVKEYTKVTTVSGNPIATYTYAYSDNYAFTRPGDTDAYASGDVIANATATGTPTVMTFSGMGPVSGKVLINDLTWLCNGEAVPPSLSGFRVHLYNQAPTAIADNAAYNLPSGDRDKYLGYVTVATPIDLGDTIYTQTTGIGKIVDIIDGNIYGIMQITSSCTPASGIGFDVKLTATEVSR